MNPAQIGKYRIDGILGEGAMGVVYKAFDPHIERVVALKTIRKALLREGDAMQLVARFKNEAQAAGRLTHQNIVAVYDYGEMADAAFIAMEYVEGMSLTALLDQGKPSGIARTMVWMNQLLQALSYAHARGVVHRDIKPANLLVTADACLKITDFGIARIESSTLTQTGALIGTPSYMSPEQFRGDPIDGRSDVFSAGIVLYQLLTGVRPFTGNSATVMHQIINEAPVPPSQREAAVHPAFDEVMRLALEKAPADRIASADAFLKALKAAHESSGAGSTAIDNTALLSEDDRTVLAVQIRHVAQAHAPANLATNQAGRALQGRPQYSGTGSETGSMDASWKLSTFPDLEAVLSTQIGPIAKVLLKRAGAKAENLDDLGTLLIPHIPSESGRSAFKAALSKLKQKHFNDDSQSESAIINVPVLTRCDASALASASASFGLPISSELVAHAEKLLPEYIGVIAKIVIKRSLLKATDSTEFIQSLAKSIEAEDQRKKFMKTIQSVTAT